MSIEKNIQQHAQHITRRPLLAALAGMALAGALPLAHAQPAAFPSSVSAPI